MGPRRKFDAGSAPKPSQRGQPVPSEGQDRDSSSFVTGHGGQPSGRELASIGSIMGTSGGQLDVGAAVDRYEIVRLIGSGAMGEVYLAVHGFTKKAVALKVLRAGQAQGAEQMSFFANQWIQTMYTGVARSLSRGWAVMATVFQQNRSGSIRRGRGRRARCMQKESGR